jgi:hypothetical protein
MRRSTSIRHLFLLVSIRAPLAVILASALVSGCGTIVCMDGPCDAVMASAYSKAVFTPNEFSESRGAEQTADDIWECKAAGEGDQVRLLTELRDFDPYLNEYAARSARVDGVGQSVGRTAANTDVDTSGSGVRVSGGGSGGKLEQEVAGAAGSIVASVFMDDGYDPNKQPLMDLEDYLEENDTFVRFTNMCLRQKGYQVDENAEDGNGAVSLNPDLLAVTIRRSDCVDVTLYKKDPLRDANGDYVFKNSNLVYSEAELPAPMPVEDCNPKAL